MKCPYCNHEYEKELTSCPACGIIIKEYEEVLEELDRFTQVDIVQPTPKKKKKKRRLSFIALFLSSIIVFLILSVAAFMFDMIPKEIKEPLNPLIAKVKQIKLPFLQSENSQQPSSVEVAKKSTKEEVSEKEKTLFKEVTDEIHSQLTEQDALQTREPQLPQEQSQEDKGVQQLERQSEEVTVKETRLEDKKEATFDVSEDIFQKEKTGQLSEQEVEQESAEKGDKLQDSEILPFTADEYLIMGLNDAASGRIEKAQEHLNNALKLSPHMSSAQQYLDLIHTTVKHDKGKEALTYYFKAEEFKKKKNKDKSIESYKKALELYPDFPDALFPIAIYYSDKKNWDKALPLLEKASAHFPDNMEINYNLGLAYMDNRKWHEAYEAFQKAREIKPDNADLLYNLGLTAGLSEKWNEADEALNQALLYRTNKGEIHYYLALSNYYRGNFEQALMHSQQAVKYKYKVHPGLITLLEPYKN